MTYAVSITSQGQISIPAEIRRKLGLGKSKTRRALVSEEGGKIIIEPVKDLLELKGSLKTNIKTTSQQIREAFERYLAEEAVKGIR